MKCYLTIVDTIERIANIKWKAAGFLLVEGNIHNFLRYHQTICAFKEALVFTITVRPRIATSDVCKIEFPSPKHLSWPLMV